MPCLLFSEPSIKTIMPVGSRTTFWIYIQWIELVIQVSHWLSFSLIWLVDLDFNLRSYRTDDYVPRLFFESSRAQNFNETWVVKLSISSVDHSPTNPTALLNRSISFQLIMKSRPNHPKEIHFMVVRAPGSDFQVWLHMTACWDYFERPLERASFWTDWTRKSSDTEEHFRLVPTCDHRMTFADLSF